MGTGIVANVKPELLRWAIDRSGVPIEELDRKFPKLTDWIHGERQPTFRQLENFAKATMAPFGAFFLPAPPVEQIPVPDFRTRLNKPLRSFSPNLLDTIHIVQQRQSWLREWMVEDGAEPLEYVDSVATNANFKTLAQVIRQRMGLEGDWAESCSTWEEALQLLRKATERIGIIVFSNSVVGFNNHRPLDPDEFRGFVLCDSIAPVVFLNDADTKSARIFTLAHEIVHVWLGEDGVFNLVNMLPGESDLEQFCNRVAAEFLVPAYKLSEFWQESKGQANRFQLIARRFKVSPLVAARRAFDLDLISKSDYFEFHEKERLEWQNVRENRRLRASGGDFYATQNVRLGRRFSAAVVRAAVEGRISYQDAYRLTGMKGKTFNTYAEVVLQRMRNERE